MPNIVDRCIGCIRGKVEIHWISTLVDVPRWLSMRREGEWTCTRAFVSAILVPCRLKVMKY